MTDPLAAPPRWRHHLKRASSAGRDVIVDATRWKRVEISVVHVLTAGLSLGVPIVLGLVLGDIGAGMVAALGALLVSGSGHVGGLKSRSVDLLNTSLAGAGGAAAGMLSTGLQPWGSIVIVALAALATVFGGLRPSAAKASTQAIVFMIIGASLASSAVPIETLLWFFAAGALGGSLLTLLVFGVEYHLLGKTAAEVAPARRSWHTDLAAWRRRLATLPGWQYTLRLASCMIVAQVVANLVRGPHSQWILLTVVLVVQRDHRAGLSRTFQRGLGTAMGVLVGGLLLGALPIWATVGIICVVGAARQYLKAANYTAYALVMTPLVAVLSGLGHQLSPSLLGERLIDTTIGCLISLIIGYAAWRRARQAA
ncbi:FUSC family protein [Arthrobacter sp. B2a2-09]|uniref:FUSC family protein n=1 Tax=Arthrobacter sp. B2a2-09 TaxID=2952822 RepID=UPI0022CD4E19|nr:FUSC family protein [Arthrobacter sp. B2a2-09]MCZ9881574.1 FUSC family protein [Arthrobacter sp. B2a2-09]